MPERANWRVTVRRRILVESKLLRVVVERLVQVEGTGEVVYMVVLGPMTMLPGNYELIKPLFDGVGAEYIDKE